MDRRHADFAAASSSFKSLFCRLYKEPYYESIQEFKDALNSWQTEFTQASPLEKLNDVQLVQYMGTHVVQIVLISQGYLISNKPINNKLQTQIKKNATPIVTATVKNAIKNLQTEPTCSALYNIKLFPDMKQGISLITYDSCRKVYLLSIKTHVVRHISC